MSIQNIILEYREIKSSPDGRFNDCWWWTGSTTNKGYGQIIYKGRNCRVHRLYYLLEIKDPGDLEVCHHCDNKVCFNPQHLFLGTHKENMEDAFNKGIIKRGKGGKFGSDTSNAKISEQERHLICEAREQGNSCKEIALKFGISSQHVSRITRGLRR